MGIQYQSKYLVLSFLIFSTYFFKFHNLPTSFYQLQMNELFSGDSINLSNLIKKRISAQAILTTKLYSVSWDPSNVSLLVTQCKSLNLSKKVVAQEKMNKTKYHLKFLFNFLFLKTFFSSKKKKNSRLGFGLFIRIKIEINFSTNICFNKFFLSYNLKKESTHYL